jgi:hypothetical protein
MDATEESLIDKHKEEDVATEKRRASLTGAEKDKDDDDDYEDDDW